MDRGELFSVKVDLTKMQVCMNRYVKEVGLGEKQVLVAQGRLLAKDISDASPPRSLSKAKERANKQVKRAFYQRPPNVFANGSKQQGNGDTAWLYAGGRGSANYVVGIDRENLNEKATMKEVLEVLKSKQRGAKWEKRTNEQGTHVRIVKKPMISRTMFKKSVKYIQDRYGRLKASWVKAAAECGCAFEAPMFVQRHVRKARGRGSFQLKEDSSLKALIFTSYADGVQSAASWKAVRAGIHGRANKMAVDLKNILNGAYKRAGFANAK